jgi:hypothetical protein
MYTSLSHNDIHELLFYGLGEYTTKFYQAINYACSFFYQPEDNPWDTEAQRRHFKTRTSLPSRSIDTIIGSLFRRQT